MNVEAGVPLVDMGYVMRTDDWMWTRLVMWVDWAWAAWKIGRVQEGIRNTFAKWFLLKEYVLGKKNDHARRVKNRAHKRFIFPFTHRYIYKICYNTISKIRLFSSLILYAYLQAHKKRSKFTYFRNLSLELWNGKRTLQYNIYVRLHAFFISRSFVVRYYVDRFRLCQQSKAMGPEHVKICFVFTR